MPCENTVFELEPGEEVYCFFCGGDDTFKRGGAFLAGPTHSPLNGNANYVCRNHLDRDAVIHDVSPMIYVKQP